MRITLETAGGLAATLGPRPVVVDDGDLDDEGREDLHRLVMAAVDDGGAEPDDAGSVRDAQTYQITIEEPGSPAVALSATDGSVPPAFGRLRDWLRALEL